MRASDIPSLQTSITIALANMLASDDCKAVERLKRGEAFILWLDVDPEVFGKAQVTVKIRTQDTPEFIRRGEKCAQSRSEESVKWFGEAEAK